MTMETKDLNVNNSIIANNTETQIKTTPMMEQFLAIKTEHSDCILFYRMGDFYELFFEDAVQASASLDITLTKRGTYDGKPIPMCGVPVHSSETYLLRLIKKGYRVAVCEQLEDPSEAKKRGAKSVVKRGVVRIVTPGTITEETILDSKTNNYLCCISQLRGEMSIAWADISSRVFYVQSVKEADVLGVLARIAPKEILLPQKLLSHPDLLDVWNEYKAFLIPLPDARFDTVNAEKRLQDVFAVGALDSFGDFTKSNVSASGTLLDYIEITQVGKLPLINRPKKVTAGDYMEIDSATRKSLEITTTMSGSRKDSLLDIMDKTITGAGARLLSNYVSRPLNNVQQIESRLMSVDFFVKQSDVREKMRNILKSIPDLDRALSRLSLGRGSPRDLASIKTGLSQTGAMRLLLKSANGDLLKNTAKNLGLHDVLVENLHNALEAELPSTLNDGGVIRKGYASELDQIRLLRDESRRVMATLEMKYRNISGVDSLKIKHNNVLQYYIEVTARHADKMTGESFIHRQTMKGAIRFTTTELSELSRDVLEAKDKALALEENIFEGLIALVMDCASAISDCATAIAKIDVFSALAEQALVANWVCPEVNNSLDFEIIGGRHPVVEKSLKGNDGAVFKTNDCILQDKEYGKMWLLTGPNMAGKSTFLRQNALISILAQMGSFVPADKCRIGLMDRIFSRVGASDDLAKGRSTFMVEMVETATILNQATEKSLVILDEIGRGTATYDGLSIAWACVEHLCDTNKCRGLFATHYHELNALSDTIDTLKSYSMAVKEWDGKVIFLHSVKKGCAEGSYGIYVAKLAGLPSVALSRAEQVLTRLEQGDSTKMSAKDIVNDLPLFNDEGSVVEVKPSEVEEVLGSVNVDDMAPRDALDFVYRLKSILEKNK